MAVKNKLSCPNCEADIIKSYDREVKLRAKIIKWTRDGMFAVCKSCNEEIEIGPDVLKSIQSNFVYEIESTC